MSFAALVHGPKSTCDAVLAYDFGQVEQAICLAQRLAWSYAEHGFGPKRTRSWFRESAGRHELKVV